MKRLLLRGGLVVDGTGASPRVADVLIELGRIVAVEPPEAMGEFDAFSEDCSGQVVAPGFIDIHTHSDVSRLHYPDSESRVRQGITTEIVGNCGMSPAPCGNDQRSMQAEMSPIDVSGRSWPRAWANFESYLDEHERTPAATNVVVLVGHGALRYAAGIEPADLGTTVSNAAVRRLADEALDAGAAGVSLGLMYSPGEAAAVAELDALAQSCAARGRLLTAHLRDYTTTGLIGAVKELLGLGNRNDARIQLSHLRSVGRDSAPCGLRALELAASSPVDVAADAYPYTAGHTTLLQLVDPALRRLGSAAVLAACVDDPGGVASSVLASPFAGEDVIVARAGTDRDVIGRSLADIATETSRSWADAAVDLLKLHNGVVDVIVFGSDPDEASGVLAHALTMIGSDGLALPLDFSTSLTHPRSVGTFPRALQVLADAGVPLEDAIAKATSLSADRIGLADRGRLRPGAIADVVVFEPNSFRDAADYLTPLVPPKGLRHVFVRGHAVLRHGQPTGARPGALLRISDS